MINVNELRIGNWINEAGKNKKVVALMKGYVATEIIDGEPLWAGTGVYNPIILTPKILLKCGFACLDKDCDLSLGPNIYFKWDKLDVKLIVDDYYLEYYDYLHELQNVYYWLKKRELRIKWKK